MADLFMVEDGFVALIAGILFGTTAYTNYTVQTTPILNIPVRVMRGWPISNQLNQDLLSGITNISVFSAPNVAKNTTKFLKRMTPTDVSRADPTMTAVLSGNQITFGGTTSTTQVIGIRSNKFGGYAYRLLSSDTPTTVAALFAAHLADASATGAILTLRPSGYLRVDVGTDTTYLTEVHRQMQMIMVSLWCPTVAIRDQLANLLDPALINNDRMYFPDDSCSGPIIGAGTSIDDVVQNEAMWRRTLYYNVEYPTMFSQIAPMMVLGQENLGPLTFID